MKKPPDEAQGIEIDNLKEPPGKNVLTIALVGNPNTGKSTLFNTLTGQRQHIANYPGITVERHSGVAYIGGNTWNIIDLPGTYSLHSRKLDEQVTARVLFGTIDHGPPGTNRNDHRRPKTNLNDSGRPGPPGTQLSVSPPDLILNIVDAANLERNLFLTTQLMDTGLPLLIVLTMDDIAREKGIAPDPQRLQRQLGVPVISVTATDRRAGDIVRKAVGQGPFDRPKPLVWQPDGALKTAIDHMIDYWIRPHTGLPPSAHITEALRLISDEHPGSPFHDGPATPALQKVLEQTVDEARSIIRQAGGNPVAIEVLSRYDFIGVCTRGSKDRPAPDTLSLTDRIDTVVTHRLSGPFIFAAVLMLIFQSIFTWAEPFMDLIDLVFIKSGMWLSANLPPGVLTEVLVDGVLAGLGGVVIFLPQIIFLFFFIHLLEGSGYMARAAFVMDRFMARLGMHGRSVVPLVSGFACAIPGIMATRSIESPRDRFITIMVLPFMTCSARLPVYALLIAAFIPPTAVLGFLNLQGVVFFGLYAFGILMAVIAAMIINRMLPKEKHRPFVMELPDYRMPDWRTVFLNTFDRGRVFVVEAGRIIIAISIVLWFLASYPKADDVADTASIAVEPGVTFAMNGSPESGYQPGANSSGDEAFVSGDQVADSDYKIPGSGVTPGARQLRNSYAGQIGRFIEPVIEPLGFDWKIGIGLITSFAAREVIVGTLNTIYSIQADNGSDEPLRQKLIGDTHPETGQPVYTIATALSLMVFFALAMQCMATIAVVRRETGTWKWPLAMLVGMTMLAWMCSFVTYQVAGLF